MTKILLIPFLFLAFIATAQTPDEGLRTAWFTQNGTARSNAIGGAIGSLGGDISVSNINPAGIAMYKTGEFVFTIGGMKNNNTFNYRDTVSKNDKGVFRYGTIGLVFPRNTSNNRNKANENFAISVIQLASFNNRIAYRGFNNYSSFSEQYIEELTKDNADTLAALSNYIFGSSLAFRTYLIDTSMKGNVFDGYKSLVPITTGVLQDYNALTRGGIHNINFTYAGYDGGKWYGGFGIDIPIISYRRDLNYSERDASNKPNNDFAYFNYTESLRSSGIGIGFKLGAIYKPKENLRIGLAFHSPQFIAVTDRIRSAMTTNTENYAHTKTETSDNLNDGDPGKRKYTLTTAYKIVGSISYIFNEVANVKKQRGFISADVELVNYRGARFARTDDQGYRIKNYYSSLHNTIKQIYKPNINFKVGGELKLNTFMLRAGMAYYGSPYDDDKLNVDRLIISGGIGYRNKGIFIDLSLSQTMINDAQFPYRLTDKANTYAVQTGNVQNVMMTVGFKF